MPLNLDTDDAETLCALLAAIDEAGAWRLIAAAMRAAGIADPEAAYDALRERAYNG